MWAEKVYLFLVYKTIYMSDEELKSEFRIDNSESFWKPLNSNSATACKKP